jgi:hypothetical protein
MFFSSHLGDDFEIEKQICHPYGCHVVLICDGTFALMEIQ